MYLFKLIIQVLVLYNTFKGHTSTKTTFTCKENHETNISYTLENSQYEISRTKDFIMGIVINYCPLPKTSFYDFIKKSRMNPDSVTMLTLYKIPYLHTGPLNAEIFKGLRLQRLFLLYDDIKILSKPTPNFLEPLKNLKILGVSGMELPPFPTTSTLKAIALRQGASSGEFGGCKDLEDVSLQRWEVSEDRWVETCTELTSLTLEHMTSVSVFHVTRGTKYLQNLYIRNCNLIAFPDDFFDHMQDLEHLDLSQNSLDIIVLKAPLPSLQVLDLSYNWIRRGRGYRVGWLLKMLPNLEALELSHNEDFDLCHNDFDEKPSDNLTVSVAIEHPNLRILSLSGTNTTHLCIGAGALPSLKLISLDGNFRYYPVITELLISHQPLTVYLLDTQDYPIVDVKFTKDDYDMLKEAMNQTILLNSIGKRNATITSRLNITIGANILLECDCKFAYFAQALREKLVKAPITHCAHTNETDLPLISPKLLECDKFSCDSCTCRRLWNEKFTIADCTNSEAVNIPQVQNITKLLAPKNHIKELRENDLPDTLLFIDISGNSISHVNENTAKTLFSKPQRRMNISGNPIVCNCENRAFIEEIQKHGKQIEDYDNVTCAGSGLPIKDVDTTKLCLKFGNGVLIATLVSSAIVAFAALSGTLYYRFRQTIHIFLYARGWCLCCLQEDELDADRPFDAFVSFCHVDENLVSEELVPQLEERGFKICVHYRDWRPGELIPTQIVRSVEASRRTIVVLSKNFVESMWGLLEFRTAHVRALRDGIARIIVIVIDDIVDDEGLDGDLRSYIKTSTYVRWGDPWFWDKLCYSMPHGRQRKSDENVELTPVTPENNEEVASENHVVVLRNEF